MIRIQAKNVVLNVSEMEAKVREATNDEPWYSGLLICSKIAHWQQLRRGASSTLMQDIAQGYVLQHEKMILDET